MHNYAFYNSNNTVIMYLHIFIKNGDCFTKLRIQPFLPDSTRHILEPFWAMDLYFPVLVDRFISVIQAIQK